MKNLCPCVPKRFPNYTHVHTHNDESAGHQVAQQVARYSSWWPGQNAQNDREWSKLSRSLCLKWLKNMSLAKFHLSVRSPAKAACWWLWCCWCKWGFALFLLIFTLFFYPFLPFFVHPFSGHLEDCGVADWWWLWCKWCKWPTPAACRLLSKAPGAPGAPPPPPPPPPTETIFIAFHSSIILIKMPKINNPCPCVTWPAQDNTPSLWHTHVCIPLCHRSNTDPRK